MATGKIAFELKKADMANLKKIKPEDWNNIPIPVCVALETYQQEIMTIFTNLTMLDQAFKSLNQVVKGDKVQLENSIVTRT